MLGQPNDKWPTLQLTCKIFKLDGSLINPGQIHELPGVGSEWGMGKGAEGGGEGNFSVVSCTQID